MKARDEKQRIGRIPDEEPIFILRGQDILAPETIEFWCQLAEKAGVSPSRKVMEARDLAKDMREWPKRKRPD